MPDYQPGPNVDSFSWRRLFALAAAALFGVLITLGVVEEADDSPPDTTTSTTQAVTTTSETPPTTVTSVPATTTPPTTVPPTTQPPEPSFPTPETTGLPADVTPTAPSGDAADGVITTDGLTVDGALWTNGLVVRAEDVTITNSRVEGNKRLVLECDGCRNLVVEDTDIIGTGRETQGCVGRVNFTLTRVEIRGCIDGVKANGNTTIQDSWIGELRRFQVSANDSTHNDGIQSTGGANITIRRNTIVHDTNGQTSVMKLSADRNPLVDAVIEDNRMIVSTCFAMYFNVQNGKSWPSPTGRITGNVVSGNTCGNWLALTPGPDQVISGNVDPDGNPL